MFKINKYKEVEKRERERKKKRRLLIYIIKLISSSLFDKQNYLSFTLYI